MSCLKMFSYILQVFVCNVWCCTVSNFYHAHDIFIIYCIGVGFLFVHLSSWIATYVYNGINIYRVWTNNRNTRQYRNKIIFVGCTDRMLFFCLCCIVPVSMHYRLYLVTVCMKVLQNGRLLRFSKRSDCWCTFSWNICNQNGHHSSSFQGYDNIQIMGEHQLRGIVVKNQN